MHPVEAYLAELRDIRASGAAVPETSGYGALANLLNEVGGKLKPKVRCFINLANAGAGIPDGGLFTPNQIPKGQHEPAAGQLPARGAIEVKPVDQTAAAVARTAIDGAPDDQLPRYLQKYRQVLVTTYRDFVLVGYDADGQPTELESFRLAGTEAEFWALAAHPGSAAARAAGERLTEFLKRAILRAAPIAAPQDLAWFLASYAREALARVEAGGERLPALKNTRTGLEEALGMTFTGEKGEHFFRSTLVQTLFYGLFSAWVDWAGHHPPAEQAAPATAGRCPLPLA